MNASFEKWNWLGGKVMFNFLAKDLSNALEVVEAAEGHALVGVLSKDFRDVDSAAAAVNELSSNGVAVSLGLGGGDPSSWRKVLDIALVSRPAHINQVFPLASYTIARLEERYGDRIPLVNALVSPAADPAHVNIGTGPLSSNCGAAVPCEAAAALISEQGIKSVKFFPLNGRIKEMQTLISSCKTFDIPVFEPTGGVSEKSLASILDAALEAGARHVVPHVYTAIIDKETGRTDPHEVSKLLEIARKVLGL